MTAGGAADADGLLKRAFELEAAGDPTDALANAWRALDLMPANLQAKRVIARLLRYNPHLVSPDRRLDLQRLLSDPELDPDALSPAGWMLLQDTQLDPAGDPEDMATWLECEPLAIRLLTGACVSALYAELALTAVRRWLMLSGQWASYPLLAQALVAQAARNGAAWPFDEDERAVLERSPDCSFAAAFVRPQPPRPPAKRFDDGVTQAVADQYVRWPYPAWSRVTAPEPSTLPHEIEKLEGGRASGLPKHAEILVAGCGTGREAAVLAKRFPDARITAIDISASSLAYAAERCAGLSIDFHLLDLHKIARLGRRFDFVASSGVLHHLRDPEAGWARLVEVLNPGGVMKIMVYSRVARLRIEAAKRHIADLLDQPVDDDLLRAVRRRLIDTVPGFVAGTSDFYRLDGVHDLLLNRHEDAFDVPRIVRALDRLGLRLLAFKLPTRADEARYRAEHPEDPLFRDIQAWVALEQAHPFLFAHMYEFWCRRD